MRFLIHEQEQCEKSYELLNSARARLIAAEYELDAARHVITNVMESIARFTAKQYGLPERWADVFDDNPYKLEVTYDDNTTEIILVVGYGPGKYHDGFSDSYVQARKPTKRGYSKNIWSFGLWVLEQGTLISE